RRGADVERHLDAFALVVMPAATYRAKVERAPADVACLHFGVAFEAAAAQHDGFRAEFERLRARPDRTHAGDRASLVLYEALRRRFIDERRAALFALCREGVHQRKPAADRQQPRLRACEELRRQEIEADAEALEPCHGVASPARECGDDLRICKAECLQDAGPLRL